MSRPSPFELELIQKIVTARIKLEGLCKSHSTACAEDDSGLTPGKCTCGAEEHNRAINEVLACLEIK